VADPRHLAPNQRLTPHSLEKIPMNPLPQMAFSHIGLYVTDMASMAKFYTEVLGFAVTDRARIRGSDVVFLSRSPDEHHQIVLVPGRAAQSASTVNQISFRVVALSELRRLHAQLLELGVSGINPTNHGGSWSVYFSDPEGNRIELLAQTPWYMPPVSIPLDLSLSDAEIFSLTEAMVEKTPGSMARSQWREQLERRLNEEGTIERRPSPPEAPGSAESL
jgi:catechol 2,3-dioxygenase